MSRISRKKCVRRLFTVSLVTVDRVSAFPYRYRYQDFSRRTAVSVPFLVFNACCSFVKSSISLSTMGTKPVVAVGIASELLLLFIFSLLQTQTSLSVLPPSLDVLWSLFLQKGRRKYQNMAGRRRCLGTRTFSVQVIKIYRTNPSVLI